MWCMWKLKITDFYFKQVIQQAIYEPDMSVITYFLLYLLHKSVLVLVTQVAYCWFIQFCSVLQRSLIWLTQQTWSAICLRTPAVLSQCLRSSKVFICNVSKPHSFYACFGTYLSFSPVWIFSSFITVWSLYSQVYLQHTSHQQFLPTVRCSRQIITP